MKLRILTIAAASALALAACSNNAEDEAAMTETDAATDATMADGGMASSATDAGSNASGTASSGGGSGGGAASAGGSTGSSSGMAQPSGSMTSGGSTAQRAVVGTENEQVPGGVVAPSTPPPLPEGQIATQGPR